MGGEGRGGREEGGGGGGECGRGGGSAQGASGLQNVVAHPKEYSLNSILSDSDRIGIQTILFFACFPHVRSVARSQRFVQFSHTPPPPVPAQRSVSTRRLGEDGERELD